MTRLEAQKRNWNIMQLIGMLPRVASLIPKDVADKLPAGYVNSFNNMAKGILSEIHNSKKKVYTCEDCNQVHGKETKSKRAVHCDYCDRWYDGIDELKLYNVIKKEK